MRVLKTLPDIVMHSFILKPFALPETWAEGSVCCRALEDALGGILAEDIRAACPVPPYDAALRDGWAVRSGESVRTPRGDVENGLVPQALGPGSALWINTGGRLPEGADAVISARSPREAGRWNAPAEPEAHVLRKGSEWQEGDLVLPAGVRLGAPELALLLEAGVLSVSVHPVPSVGILSTGSELETKTCPGGLFRARRKASDAFFAVALLASVGIRNRPVRLIPDDPGTIAGTLLELTASCDVVLTIGGTGGGKKDFMRGVLADLGGRIVPAPACSNDTPPFIAGELQEKPVIGLPGNPLGLVMILERTVLPLLLARMGRPFSPGREAAVFEGEVPEGQRGDLCVHLFRDGGGTLRARPIPKGTGRSKIFLEANGVVSLDGKPLGPGERVAVERFL